MHRFDDVLAVCPRFLLAGISRCIPPRDRFQQRARRRPLSAAVAAGNVIGGFVRDGPRVGQNPANLDLLAEGAGQRIGHVADAPPAGLTVEALELCRGRYSFHGDQAGVQRLALVVGQAGKVIDGERSICAFGRHAEAGSSERCVSGFDHVAHGPDLRAVRQLVAPALRLDGEGATAVGRGVSGDQSQRRARQARRNPHAGRDRRRPVERSYVMTQPNLLTYAAKANASAGVFMPSA